MVGKVVVNVGMQISAVDDVISFKYSVQKPPPGPSNVKLAIVYNKVIMFDGYQICMHACTHVHTHTHTHTHTHIHTHTHACTQAFIFT